jgi:hypothetical protein
MTSQCCDLNISHVACLHRWEVRGTSGVAVRAIHTFWQEGIVCEQCQFLCQDGHIGTFASDVSNKMTVTVEVPNVLRAQMGNGVDF